MFNLQSGQHRQSFPSRGPKSRAMKMQSNSESTKHTKSVTGLMIDNLNRTVISCGLDGKVKVSSSGFFQGFCMYNAQFALTLSFLLFAVLGSSLGKLA